MPRYIIFYAILLISCGYALWRGRRDERIAAIVFLAATVISVAGHLSFQIRYESVDVGEVLVDSAVLISVVLIALVSDRFWPLWIAGFQLVDSMAHLMKVIDVRLPAWGYAIAERFWSYPILIVLFIGAWRQHRRAQLEQQRIAT